MASFVQPRLLTAALLAVLELGGCPNPQTRDPGRLARPQGDLEARLRSAQWEQRAAAARQLGASGRADAVALLKGALADRVRAVRLAAVSGLSRVGTKAAGEAMVEALDGQSLWLRPAVADGLARLPAKVLADFEVAVDVLMAELVKARGARRALLLRGLRSAGELALRKLLIAMYSPPKGLVMGSGTDVACRRVACRALVALGRRDSQRLLRLARRGVPGLDDAQLRQVLLPVVLARVGEGALRRLLPHVLLRGVLGRLAHRTIRQLGPRALPWLQRLISSSRTKTARLAAVAALGRLGTPAAKKLLAQLTRSRDRAIAGAAARALNPAPMPPPPLGNVPLGVPACDHYAKTYRCYVRKLPKSKQVSVRDTFRKMLSTWLSLASGSGRSSLDRACRMAYMAFAQAYAANAQYSACLKP